ncbi:thioesterase superfamily protein [Actibacterium atlanticum]|uniref:Thioesterase superfamily protein n=1 Tax=Actibacterium atlanticum TaxID=1461693 RepID=A0A058ZP36_9RHOB|nr:acyl-CoA thioesterase [Actibacterium atlanticum]KCV83359.1 thioesterase superfamily protein [Actibacterium atlanticum]
MDDHYIMSAESPTVRVIAMPSDTNPAGDIFGGWLMSQMDLAAGSVASLYSRGRSATISVEEIQFQRPVKVGDEVSIYTEMLKVGRSSMRILVKAYRRARHQEKSEQVTQAVFTFVALDENGQARPAKPA